MIYSIGRRCYVQYIKKARKDNPAVKKGSSYIKVRRDKYAKIEYFKNIEDLDKKYPHYFTISSIELAKYLKEYKSELKLDFTLTPEEFIKSLINPF